MTAAVLVAAVTKEGQAGDIKSIPKPVRLVDSYQLNDWFIIRIDFVHDGGA